MRLLRKIQHRANLRLSCIQNHQTFLRHAALKKQVVPPELLFHEEEGIIGFVRDLNKKAEVLHDVVYFKGESEDITVEAAFQYTNEFHENILGFCNNIYNAEGGTHITGFKTIFKR